MSKVNTNDTFHYTNSYLKETFSDDKITVSDVDIDAMHRHISSNDAQTISDIIHDALTSMDIEHDGFGWDLNVTVEKEV
tara:strand:+ start:435 stop:671 length:237 start_codon:yes stop_codon:yes gene_type:complete